VRTHDLIVHLFEGTSIKVPTHRPEQTGEDVARALAERLKGGAALWAPSAHHADDNVQLGAVVIPAAAIAFVEVLDAAPAEPSPPAADASEVDAVMASVDHAAATDADTATTAPAQPTAPAAETVPPAAGAAV
jgi:hypothetical protein